MTETYPRFDEFLGQEALDGALQQFVVGMALQRFGPDLLRLILLAEHPQHLAEVGGDLRIGALLERTLQVVQPLLAAAMR